jgi:UDPglucose 6-dehydrogenase
MKIAVIGIGNVGLPFAAVASKFHEVVGIDTNIGWIKKLKQNIPLVEPRLNEYLTRWPIKLCTDSTVVKECELIFVAIGNQEDHYRPNTVIRAVENICPYLVSKKQVLVIVSTLKPDSMKKYIIPSLEKKALNRILGVCYNPSFVALGSAIKHFNDPEYVLIGESNHEAGLNLDSFYRTIVPKRTKIYHSTFENVEVFKYLCNFALINKISLLNVMTEFCEKYGADIDFVTQALKHDRRIAGPKMFRGGLGFGGTCFPIDGRAFRDSEKKAAMETVFVHAIMKVNERQITRTVSLIRKLGERQISILGITYKENTSSTNESQALEIARKLAEDKDVMIYDPKGMDEARRHLGSAVKYAKDLEEALAFGKVILIAVMWPEFRRIKDTDLKNNQIVVDPWRLFRERRLGCRYIPFGLSEDQAE